MKFTYRTLQTAFILISAAGLTHANPFYTVTVNTSSVLSTAGYMNFQMDYGGLQDLNDFATITGFTAPGGTLGSVNPTFTTGNTSGALPSTITLTNDGVAQANQLTQGITFGTSMQWIVTLGGAAVNTPDGKGGGTFAFTLLDSSLNPILTTDLNFGTVFTVDVTGAGSTNPTVTSSQTTIQGSVPEPASGAVVGAALLLAFSLRRRAIRVRG